VPYYDPSVVYGKWPDSNYPPYSYYPEPGYLSSGSVATGMAFGAGNTLGRWTSGERFCGGGINWGGGQIDSNCGPHVSHWKYNPHHRRGVGYNNPSLRQRFGGNAIQAGNEERLDFRDRSGQQVLKPGAERTKLGEHQPADSLSVGDRGRRTQVSQAKHFPSNADLSAQHGSVTISRRAGWLSMSLITDEQALAAVEVSVSLRS
jgi:hypothetical protein